MLMKEIIDRCTQIPDVSMKEADDSTELLLDSGDGSGKMTFYPMFPGIVLAYIHVNAPKWQVPALLPQDSQSTGIMLLNYCIKGRCELMLENNTYVYVKEGELSLSVHSAHDSCIFPRKIYEGIEMFICAEAVKNQADFLQKEFFIDAERIAQKFCADNEAYIARCGSEIKAPLNHIWNLYGEKSTAAAFERKTAALRALGLLSCREDTVCRKPQVFFTAAQVDIAKRVEKMITADLRQRHTAREMAQMLCVSETSLKRYFRGVYGLNISEYISQIRMNFAADKLICTSLSIAEIAQSVGYLNQSKFSAAFKAHFAMPPLEYRRVKRLEGHKGS